MINEFKKEMSARQKLLLCCDVMGFDRFTSIQIAVMEKFPYCFNDVMTDDFCLGIQTYTALLLDNKVTSMTEDDMGQIKIAAIILLYQWYKKFIKLPRQKAQMN